MKRSYAEDEMTRHEVDRKQALQELETDIGSLEQLDCPVCSTDLDHYYGACARIKNLQQQMQVHCSCAIDWAILLVIVDWVLTVCVVYDI